MPYRRVLWSLKRQKPDPLMVERSVDEVVLALGTVVACQAARRRAVGRGS
jgi:hypothetical protein